jgi:acyl-CoA synthetase (AMP-forming)/AMP-acid ligase II
LHSGLAESAARYGDRSALLVDDDEWSFRRVDAASNALAAFLSPVVPAGSRVALMLTNRPEFLVAVLAISKVGAASVLLSSAWKRREVAHALALTEPGYAIADSGGGDLLRELLGSERVLDLDDAHRVAAALSAASPLPSPVDRGPDDEALLVFSSGTTGMPKAARHTHGSMAAAIDHWVAALGLTAEDRFQVATPPSHILGLLNLLTAVAAGATVRLHRRFDLDELLRRIEQERMTLEMAVAPIALAMADHPRLEQFDLSSLRYIMWGATPVTPSIAERVTARSGVRWLPAYGASELPVIAVNPIDDPAAWRLDSAGLPPPGVELRVVDLDTKLPLEPGGVGEIEARSRSMMVGYLPAADTAEAFHDGWYRTGDVGWLEREGWVHLTDRSKEMIKVKGFQVAPAEIEAVLHGHPHVRDCAVFGIPDPVAGEVPVAAVAVVPGKPVTPEELVSLVAESLAGYKQLYAIEFVEEIPRLPSGKVLRRTLRQSWLESVGTAATTAD